VLCIIVTNKVIGDPL